MPRKKLIVSNVLPYHMTFRANNREVFPLPLEEVWDLLGDRLLGVSWFHGAKLHAVVLMPNHVHILLSTPGDPIWAIAQWLLSRFTRDVNLRAGRWGRAVGARYYWNLVQDSRYYEVAYKYVLRNPVKAALSSQVEDYPFSSLRGLLGFDRLRFPLYLPLVPLGGPSSDPHVADILPWLNSPFPSFVERGMQAALKKRIWDRILDPQSRKQIVPLGEELEE